MEFRNWRTGDILRKDWINEKLIGIYHCNIIVLYEYILIYAASSDEEKVKKKKESDYHNEQLQFVVCRKHAWPTLVLILKLF